MIIVLIQNLLNLKDTGFSGRLDHMKFIFSSLISLCLLTTLLFGQSSERPETIVIPVSSLGEVSEVRKQILQNTLEDELKSHFRLISQEKFEDAQEKAFE